MSTKGVSIILAYELPFLISADQIPNDVPSLRLQTSGESWYRTLRQVGFEYGPSFQNMIKIFTDHRLPVVSCEASMRQETSSTKDHSSFPVHPGSIDCCLQSIIVSIYAGKIGSVTHAFVPISVDSITVWSSGLPTKGKIAKVNTRVYKSRDRHHSAHSQLISEDGKVLVDFRGVHCVAYEAAVPQSSRRAQESQLPYWRARWMPDLTLTPVSKALKVFRKPSVGDILALICHKWASASILDLGGRYAVELAKNDASVDIAVAAGSDQALQSKKDLFEDLMFVKFLKLDFTEDGFRPTPDQSYDVIISSEVTTDSYSALRLPCTKSTTVFMLPGHHTWGVSPDFGPRGLLASPYNTQWSDSALS